MPRLWGGWRTLAWRSRHAEGLERVVGRPLAERPSRYRSAFCRGGDGAVGDIGGVLGAAKDRGLAAKGDVEGGGGHLVVGVVGAGGGGGQRGGGGTWGREKLVFYPRICNFTFCLLGSRYTGDFIA